MNIQGDVLLNNGAFTALSSASERNVLPFCLADYNVGALPAAVSTPVPVHTPPAFDVNARPEQDESPTTPEPQTALFYPFQYPPIPIPPPPVTSTALATHPVDDFLPMDASRTRSELELNHLTHDSFLDSNPSLPQAIPQQEIKYTVATTPAPMDETLSEPKFERLSTRPVPTDSIVDTSQPTPSPLDRIKPNIGPHQNESLLDQDTTPYIPFIRAEPIKIPAEATESIESFPFPINATSPDKPPAINDIQTEETIALPGKTFVFESSPIQERKPNKIESDNTPVDNSQTTQITPQKRAEYDMAIHHLTQFINKKISVPEPISGSTPAKARPIQVNETASALPFREYKAGDAGIGLKIEPYTAKIKIHPPDLGQVTAEIIMDKGKTALTLTTESKQVTDFIALHLSALHEKFSDSNIHLSEVTLQQNGQQPSLQNQQQFTQHQTSSGKSWEEGYRQDKEEPMLQQQASSSNSLVDTYA